MLWEGLWGCEADLFLRGGHLLLSLKLAQLRQLVSRGLFLLNVSVQLSQFLLMLLQLLLQRSLSLLISYTSAPTGERWATYYSGHSCQTASKRTAP